MKKMVLIIMAICVITSLGMATAQADWYSVKVMATGAGWGSTYINLTHASETPAFTNQWFILDPTYANQHLASALTAISTGLKMMAFFSGTGVPPSYTVVSALYVDNGFQ